MCIAFQIFCTWNKWKSCVGCRMATGAIYGHNPPLLFAQVSIFLFHLCLLFYTTFSEYLSKTRFLFIAGIRRRWTLETAQFSFHWYNTCSLLQEMQIFLFVSSYSCSRYVFRTAMALHCQQSTLKASVWKTCSGWPLRWLTWVVVPGVASTWLLYPGLFWGHPESGRWSLTQHLQQVTGSMLFAPSD